MKWLTVGVNCVLLFLQLNMYFMYVGNMVGNVVMQFTKLKYLKMSCKYDMVNVFLMYFYVSLLVDTYRYILF